MTPGSQASPGQMKPRVVLVGPPGSGKTTVGTLLASTLDVPFRDTDADIVATTGKSISDLFIEDGEEAFRALERSAVTEALSTFDGVLALGGGAVLAEATRAALRGHTVVFLSVELTDALARVGLGAGRPLLALNPRATLRHQLDVRRPLYEEVATITVHTDGREPADIVAEILGAIRD